MDNNQYELNTFKKCVASCPGGNNLFIRFTCIGTPDANSDIDIFMVVPDDTTELSELYADIKSFIRKKTH